MSSTVAEQGAAAKQAADNKTAKFQGLENTHTHTSATPFQFIFIIDCQPYPTPYCR